MLAHLSRLKLPSILLTLRNVIGILAFSFFPLFLREKGYALWFIVLMTALYTGLSLLIVFVPSFPLRSSLFIGFLLTGAASLSLLLPLPYAAYVYSLLVGGTLIFFWVPINYMFFAHSQKNTNATDSTLYVLVLGIVGVVLPPLGAWLIASRGYAFMFAVAALPMVIPLFLVWRYVPKENHPAPLGPSIAQFRGLKTITLVEGALHMFPAQVIPIYTLLFLNTAAEFGRFLSYLALVAFVIALLVSLRSDKLQQRKVYLYVLMFALAIITVLFAGVDTLKRWYVLVGLYTLVNHISFPIRLAVSLDVKKADMGFWKVRELFLNIGRVVVQSLAALFFYLNLSWAVFGMFAILTIIYPFVVERKLKGIK